MTLYLEVTQDELSLPLCVSINVQELCNKTGLKYHNIYSQIAKGKNGIIKRPRFISVEIDEEGLTWAYTL